MKVIIQKTKSEETIFVGTSLTDYYLNNDNRYTLFFMYKDFYPQIIEIDLTNAPSSQNTLQLPLKVITKNHVNLIKEFDSTYVFSSDQKYYSNYLNALSLTAESHPKTKFEIVYYQSDLKLDSNQINATNDSSVFYINDNSKLIINELKKISLASKSPVNIVFSTNYKAPIGALKPKGFYIITR